MHFHQNKKRHTTSIGKGLRGGSRSWHLKQIFQVVSMSLICLFLDGFWRILRFGDGCCSGPVFSYYKTGSTTLDEMKLSLVF